MTPQRLRWWLLLRWLSWLLLVGSSSSWSSSSLWPVLPSRSFVPWIIPWIVAFVCVGVDVIVAGDFTCWPSGVAMWQRWRCCRWRSLPWLDWPLPTRPSDWPVRLASMRLIGRWFGIAVAPSLFISQNYSGCDDGSRGINFDFNLNFIFFCGARTTIWAANSSAAGEKKNGRCQVALRWAPSFGRYLNALRPAALNCFCLVGIFFPPSSLHWNLIRFLKWMAGFGTNRTVIYWFFSCFMFDLFDPWTRQLVWAGRFRQMQNRYRTENIIKL